MWGKKYGEWEDLEKLLLDRKIVEWDKEKLVLDDGLVITIECSEQDCCASAGGQFKNVELDAMITGVIRNDKGNRVYNGDGHDSNVEIVLFHNQNIVAQADCWANDGNGGYYYSVGSFVVKDIHYKVVSA